LRDTQLSAMPSVMQDKDIVIAQLLEEIARLREEVRLLKEEIARLKKDSSNSSRPPSSDIVKPKKTTTKRFRKKRKRGGQHGHKKFSRQPFEPEQVDQTFDYELTAQDAAELEPLDEWFIIQQIELPEKMYKVIEHRARKYFDPVTGKTHIAADVTASIAFMKGRCHMSYTTIQQFFKEVMKLDISRGMLNKATQKVSASLEGAYQQIVERMPKESYLGIDETGHKDNGDKYWTWCFQSPDYSLFHIDKSRGSKVLFDLLGKEYEGIIGCDFWGAYRKFFRLGNATVQYCMAHLIREVRFLAEHTNNKLSDWGQKLLDWLRKLFNTLHRRDKMTAKGFIRSMERIKAGFLKRMRRPPNHKLAKK